MDSIAWLRSLAERGGKGTVDKIDARALGRIADEIERLRSHGMVSWQPIETAPKEGLLFLGWIEGSVDIGGWDNDPRAERPRPFWNWNDPRGRKYMRDDPPTHWMPLHDPPVASPPLSSEDAQRATGATVVYGRGDCWPER